MPSRKDSRPKSLQRATVKAKRLVPKPRVTAKQLLAKSRRAKMQPTAKSLQRTLKGQAAHVGLGEREVDTLRQLCLCFGERQLAQWIGVHQTTLLRACAGFVDRCTPTARRAFARFFAA